MYGLGDNDGIRSVAVNTDGFSDNADIDPIDGSCYSFGDRTSNLGCDLVRFDDMVVLRDDLSPVIIVIEIGIKFAREGDAASREYV